MAVGDGQLRRLYGGWAARLTRGLAHLEAAVDFGDEVGQPMGAHQHTHSSGLRNNAAQFSVTGAWTHTVLQQELDGAAVAAEVRPLAAELAAEIAAHLGAAGRAERVRSGLRLVLAGPPNAGKSSL